MIKKDQIEKMAKDYYGYSIDSEADCEFVAEEMYNKGHRKLSEDSVVLSREEYEKLKQYEEKVENGACFTQKEWLELCDEEYKRETENLSKVRQLERKETAKEILREIRGYYPVDLEHCDKGEAFILELCYELANKYDVEIEE